MNNEQLKALAELLVTPERFGEIALICTVKTEYPDLPEQQRLWGEEE